MMYPMNSFGLPDLEMIDITRYCEKLAVSSIKMEILHLKKQSKILFMKTWSDICIRNFRNSIQVLFKESLEDFVLCPNCFVDLLQSTLSIFIYLFIQMNDKHILDKSNCMIINCLKSMYPVVYCLANCMNSCVTEYIIITFWPQVFEEFYYNSERFISNKMETLSCTNTNSL